MSKIIGVDLDEVLAEFFDHALEFHDYKIGTYTLEREKIKDYYIHKNDFIDITVEEAIIWFRQPMYDDMELCRIPVVPGAKEKLLELKQAGYKLFVVTARIEELFGEYTKTWIEKYFPSIFDNIIFADHFHETRKEKSELCHEYGIEIMIEDNYDYAVELAQNGIKTYLLEKPWNSWQDGVHENIIRVKSWENIKL
ncbi:MAG: HAD hydrolase-like protein [Candidatus Gracilibacteria bacterium]|nr:HAD hydrolase-like protein [Candidatus Gracilibacteria bacterium]